MRFAPLRGFRDYLPPEAGARSEIRRRMRAVARRSGFSELETPTVESQDLYRVKSGGEIVEQLWAFSDKGGREVALAPETTPSLARIFAERASSEPLPTKWFSVGKLWRYEEPQAGRTREFGQFNLDLLGVASVDAEAELLATASQVMDAVGAEGLYAFRVNDRQVADAIGRKVGAQVIDAYFRALDAHLKVSPAELARALEATGVSEKGRKAVTELIHDSGTGVPCDQVPKFLDRIEQMELPDPGPKGLTRLRELFTKAPAFGLADRLFFDPGLVRGIAYYTSTVFEAFDTKGAMRALFGGGRYDNLIELFGGPPTPAVGLAIGDQTLELLLKAHQRWPEGEPPLDTYVVAVSEADRLVVFDYVQQLRRAGVSADCDLMGRSLSKQLKEAARRRARRALLVGPKERQRGIVVERDLASGVQRDRTVPEALAPG